MTEEGVTPKDPNRILNLLNSGNLIKVCAPMVRYSKLPFRMTVREYGVDICYTPMILADSFIRSKRARDLEFPTSPSDHPTVIQFASNNLRDYVYAYEMICPFVDGVDLNCGCPQKWALQEGIGAAMMNNPQLIKEMILTARQSVASSDYTPISVKMRIFGEEEGTTEDSVCRRSVELARQIEAAGASWIAVHGRNKKQKSSEPVDYHSIKLIKQSINIPVIANGNIDRLGVAMEVARDTGVNGVMTATALLSNPALFAGYSSTPWECVDKFVNYSLAHGTHSALFHHHLAKMTTLLLSPSEHRTLNTLSNSSIPTILEFLRQVERVEK